MSDLSGNSAAISAQPLPTPPSAQEHGFGVQAMRFLVSGVIAAVVDLGLTWTLRLGLGFDVVPSRSTGFIFGTLTAYLINRRWTFRAEPSWRRFFAVAVLYGITFGINVGGQKLGEHLFLSWGWAPVFALVVAFVISQGIATVINFIVQRTVIFKVS